jgi:ribonuclease J
MKEEMNGIIPQNKSLNEHGNGHAEELIFVPLGGAGEIGMNLNLYGYDNKWLMVDFGVMFGDDTKPGFDVLMPDIRFIEERRKDLMGIVLTHAHEDHIGAVPYLWPRLRCPIYATPFTASLVRKKLLDAGITDHHIIREIPLGGKVKISHFEVEFIALTHSIPEPSAILISTPTGKIFHTGDWKIDPSPLIGKPINEDYLKSIGERGIDAMVCDSTNALNPGSSGSEGTVREHLIEMIGRFKKQRVAVGCFASNIARLESIALAAMHHGRRVALAGRSLWRLDEAARQNGYLASLPRFLDEKEGMSLPREKILYLCTGSQGEERAALTRIARGDHQSIKFDPEDVVIFSSRVIPGNEKAIGRLQNNLIRGGIEVITAKDDDSIHVSGHPAQDELKLMYSLIKPRISIPVHGEDRHMVAHGKLAKSWGVPEVVVVENGSVVKIGPGTAEVVDKVHSGQMAVDGTHIIPLTGRLLRYRSRVIEEGFVVATVAIDGKGVVRGDLQLTGFGLWDHDPNEEEWWATVEAVQKDLMELSPKHKKDDDIVIEALHKSLRKVLRLSHGKKPIVEVNIIHV